MREDAVMKFLERTGADFSIIEELLSEKQLICSEYQRRKFLSKEAQELIFISFSFSRM